MKRLIINYQLFDLIFLLILTIDMQGSPVLPHPTSCFAAAEEITASTVANVAHFVVDFAASVTKTNSLNICFEKEACE